MQTTPTAAPDYASGANLPNAETLIELLNRLGAAKDSKRSDEIAVLEEQILTLAKPGIYEGYAGDEPRTSFVRVLSTQRKNSDANIHSFEVTFEILDGVAVVAVQKMELLDFLATVNRTLPLERQHIGPRFWPL